MIKSSTGLAAYLMVTGSLKSAFDAGVITVYSGTPPASADDAITGSALWVISKNGAGVGTGVTYSATPVGRALVKPPADTWEGPTAAGTATYWRATAPGDTGATSTTEKRLQGLCGTTADADMRLTSTTFVTNAAVSAKILDDLSIALPTL